MNRINSLYAARENIKYKLFKSFFQLRSIVCIEPTHEILNYNSGRSKVTPKPTKWYCQSFKQDIRKLQDDLKFKIRSFLLPFFQAAFDLILRGSTIYMSHLIYVFASNLYDFQACQPPCIKILISSAFRFKSTLPLVWFHSCVQRWLLDVYDIVMIVA